MKLRVEVDGLRELRKALRAADAQLPREMRRAMNAIGQTIVNEARPEVPVKTGRLKESVRARSTQTEGRVIMGKASVPYAGFIEFGGAVGRNKSVKRRFVKDGRFLYPAFVRRAPEVARHAEHVIDEMAKRVERGS